MGKVLMIKRMMMIAVVIAAATTIANGQAVPLDTAWFLGGIGFTGSPVVVNGPYVQFHWFNSPASDGPCGLSPEIVTAQQPAVGYMVRPWTGAITGSTISVTFKLKVKSGAPVFNYIFETGNTGCYPAYVRIYFQTGALNNATAGTRWYSSAAVELDTALGQTVTITAPLDPAAWTDQYGKSGLIDGGFYAALAAPTYVGVVFGGGDFYAHGINTSNGVVQFQLQGWVSR